jgi:hypothetical protein
LPFSIKITVNNRNVSSTQKRYDNFLC